MEIRKIPILPKEIYGEIIEFITNKEILTIRLCNKTILDIVHSILKRRKAIFILKPMFIPKKECDVIVLSHRNKFLPQELLIVLINDYNWYVIESVNGIVKEFGAYKFKLDIAWTALNSRLIKTFPSLEQEMAELHWDNGIYHRYVQKPNNSRNYLETSPYFHLQLFTLSSKSLKKIIVCMHSKWPNDEFIVGKTQTIWFLTNLPDWNLEIVWSFDDTIVQPSEDIVVYNQEHNKFVRRFVFDKALPLKINN